MSENEENTGSGSEVPDTESYRELLNDDETMKLLQQEIENLIDLRLQEIGISSEWNRIPRKTYEKTMEIIHHQNELLKKTIPNFDRIKRKLEMDINKKCGIDNENERGKNKNRKKLPKTKQETVNTRQNIVKIVCKPKPRPRKPKEKLILPSRRNPVTISNPILFETQDSSTESDSYEPRNAMSRVMDELEFNFNSKKRRKEVKCEETPSGTSETKKLDITSRETSDSDSPKLTNLFDSTHNPNCKNRESRSRKTLNLKQDVLVESDSDSSDNLRAKNKNHKSLKSKELGSNSINTTSKIKFEDLSISDSSENEFNSKNMPTDKPYSSLKSTEKSVSIQFGQKTLIDENYHREIKFDCGKKNPASIFDIKNFKERSKLPESAIYQKSIQDIHLSHRKYDNLNITRNSRVPQQTVITTDSNIDIFESSEDENMVQMFKAAEILKLKDSKSSNDTKITQVLPKSKKLQNPKMGSKVKHVLFDIDND